MAASTRQLPRSVLGRTTDYDNVMFKLYHLEVEGTFYIKYLEI